MKIKVQFFEERLVDAVGAGVYEIYARTDDKEELFYVGESVFVLVRCATHLYEISKGVGYLGFDEEKIGKDNITLIFKLYDNVSSKKDRIALEGFREAGQTVANAFRTFADKPEVDYSQKEQKHPITKAVLAPMKAVKKMLVSIEIHLDASIDKLDNLAMDVRMDKEKNKDDMKHNDQMEADRKEAAPERVEAEIVYAPVVAETHEYQYNADAFEARGAADMKVEIGKEVSKVREDKAR